MHIVLVINVAVEGCRPMHNHVTRRLNNQMKTQTLRLPMPTASTPATNMLARLACMPLARVTHRKLMLKPVSTSQTGPMVDPKTDGEKLQIHRSAFITLQDVKETVWKWRQGPGSRVQIQVRGATPA